MDHPHHKHVPPLYLAVEVLPPAVERLPPPLPQETEVVLLVAVEGPLEPAPDTGGTHRNAGQEERHGHGILSTRPNLAGDKQPRRTVVSPVNGVTDDRESAGLRHRSHPRHQPSLLALNKEVQHT